MIMCADGQPGGRVRSNQRSLLLSVARMTALPRLVRRTRTVMLPTGALLASLLVSCSGANDTPAGGEGDSTLQAPAATVTPAVVDVCSLLTPSDITTATGLSWAEGAFDETLSAQDRFVCNWYNAGGGYALVQVMVVANPAAFDQNRVEAADVFGLAEGSLVIAGADGAYATEEGSLVGMDIQDRFVQVTYVPPGPGNVLDATRQLAQVVAERL